MEIKDLILEEFSQVSRVDSSREKITTEQIDYYNEVVRCLLQMKTDEYDPDTKTLEEFITETVNKLYDCNLLPWKYVKQYEESIGEVDKDLSYPYLECEFKGFLGIEEDDYYE